MVYGLLLIKKKKVPYLLFSGTVCLLPSIRSFQTTEMTLNLLARISSGETPLTISNCIAGNKLPFSTLTLTNGGLKTFHQ